MTNSSDRSSAVSASAINIFPRGGKRRSRSVSRSNSSVDLNKLEDIYQLVDDLKSKANLAITDARVKHTISKLRSALLFLDDSNRQLVANYLKANVCSALDTTNMPGNSVGNFLCGCFSINGNGAKTSCTAACAMSPFNDTPCAAKVLYFGKDSQGNFSSQVLSEADTTTCNVFVEPGTTITTDQRNLALMHANCQSSTYYNAVQNTPISLADFTPSQPAVQQIPTVASIPTNANSEATTAATTTSKVATVYGSSTGTTPVIGPVTVSSYPAGGVSLWVTFGIVIFILLLLVIIFAIWRYNTVY